MAFLKRWSGQLNPYTREFELSNLLREVSLLDYFARRYPQDLVIQSEYARASRERERELIAAEIQPGDALWLWQEGEWPFESGGLAVKREGAVVPVWLTWMYL